LAFRFHFLYIKLGKLTTPGQLLANGNLLLDLSEFPLTPHLFLHYGVHRLVFRGVLARSHLLGYKLFYVRRK
jgi:hypothetical protein